MKLRKILTVLLFLTPIMSYSNSYDIGDLVIKDVWARPTIGLMKNSAIYLKIINKSDQADSLIKVYSPIAERIEIHKTVEINNVNKMVAINKLAVPGNNLVELAPKGLHIMILGIHQELKDGDKFPLTLNFVNNGSIEVIVKVKKIS